MVATHLTDLRKDRVIEMAWKTERHFETIHMQLVLKNKK
jgi:hypothetical protein